MYMELTKKQHQLINKCAVYANGAYSMENLGTFIENKATDAQAFEEGRGIREKANERESKGVTIALPCNGGYIL